MATRRLDPVTGLLTDTTSSARLAQPKKPAPRPTVTPAAPPTILPGTGAVGDPVTGGFSSAPVPVPRPLSAQDLQDRILNDPLYKQTAADIAATRVSDEAGRTAARQRSLVLYGGIPDLTKAAGALSLTGDIGGDINDNVRQLAEQNTTAGLSTTARLRKAYDDAVSNLTGTLTARGLLSSGETGYQLGRQTSAYDQSQYDAVQQLVDTLAGIQNSFAQSERDRQNALAAAAAAAAGRIPYDAGGYYDYGPPPAPDSGPPSGHGTPTNSDPRLVAINSAAGPTGAYRVRGTRNVFS